MKQSGATPLGSPNGAPGARKYEIKVFLFYHF